MQGVIAHEYFHNWTGNRVTCRDWFQLTLKEGLTVFRDRQARACRIPQPLSSQPVLTTLLLQEEGCWRSVRCGILLLRSSLMLAWMPPVHHGHDVGGGEAHRGRALPPSGAGTLGSVCPRLSLIKTGRGDSDTLFQALHP